MSDTLNIARLALRAAIERRAEREKCARTADLARGRGEALVREVRARLSRSDAEARQAVERQVKAIRSGGTAVLPSAAPFRALAEGELKQATATLDVLSREYAEAQQELRLADAAVREAAAQVVTLEAEAIAEELIDHRQRAHDLRNLLLGLSYVRRNNIGDFRPWLLTHKISAALNWDAPQLPGCAKPLKDSTSLWTAYRDALAYDSRASLAIPTGALSSSATTKPTA